MSRDTHYQQKDKDYTVLREGDSAFVQHRSTRSPIRDYSLKHKVEVFWDLNDEAMRDRMFKLKVDEHEVILDYEEVLRAIRFV